MKIKDLTQDTFKQVEGLSILVFIRGRAPIWHKTQIIFLVKDANLITQARQQHHIQTIIDGVKRSFGGGTKIAFQ